MCLLVFLGEKSGLILVDVIGDLLSLVFFVIVNVIVVVVSRVRMIIVDRIWVMS